MPRFRSDSAKPMTIRTNIMRFTMGLARVWQLVYANGFAPPGGPVWQLPGSLC